MQVNIKKECEMYFYGALRGPTSASSDNTNKSCGIGIIFVALDNGVCTHSSQVKVVPVMKLSARPS